MGAPTLRHSLIALVLATYGLCSAGGSGLHAFSEGGREASHPEQHDESPHHDHDSGHGDCPICLVTGQGQLSLDATPPLAPARVTIEGPSLPPLSPPPASLRAPSVPRAPPAVRA